MPVLYCIDTSAILDGWVRYYPPDVFPAFWDRIETMIRGGTLISSEEVLDELGRKDDEVHKWAKTRYRIFVPLDDPTQGATSEVLAAFPELVKAIKDRSRADPFVIALARVLRATVVTGEKNEGTPSRPRIPLVCQHFSVPCMNLIGMMRAEGWKFG
ncbi:MAG: DUF4411 family protein [Candidatus Eisenbacteria bacterium]